MIERAGTTRRGFLTAAVASASTAALAACGGGSTNSGSGSKGKPTTLNVQYFSNVSPPQELNTFFSTYESQSGIKIKYAAEPQDYGAFVQQITTYLSSGYSGVDVLWIDDFLTQAFGTAGWIQPLDDVIDPAVIKAVSPATLKLSTINGHLVRIPGDLDAVVFIYRKDILDRLGLKPPTTWDEIVSVGKEVTQGSRYGIGIAGKAGSTQLFNELCYYLPQAGGNTLQLTSPGSQEALQFMHDLIQVHHIAPPDTAAATYTTLQAKFNAGQIVMWPTWSGLLGGIESNKAFSGTDKVAVAVPPKGPSSPTTITAAWGWAINKYSPNKEAAAHFINYAASAQAETILARTLQPPARTDLLAKTDIQKLMVQGKALAEYTAKVPITFRPIPSIKVANGIEVPIGSYLNGQSSLTQAANNAQAIIGRG